jgi:SWI/SNF-related matrix-associated actin-dependent regulator 1 of chromatin subfamily A
MTPMPTQLSGAAWLAPRRRAFLWDSPRVGKTGAVVMAADYILAKRILVVTTASGRGVWRRAFPAWRAIDRRVRVIGADPEGPADVVVVSWGMLDRVVGLFRARPDLIVLDEDQDATNPDAKRSQIVYGAPASDGAEMLTARAIVQPGDRVWHLSGSPFPHDLGNGWMRLRASFPELLKARNDWPDVTRFGDFRDRYCRMGRKKLPNGERIPVVLGGKNESELRQRINGTFLRRTQKDVGIQPPRYETLPLVVDAAERARFATTPREREILTAAAAGKTYDLEMELGPLWRQTGVVKARAVVEAIKEQMRLGLEKVVLAYWHRDVGDILAEGLVSFGVVRLDGSTSPNEREQCEKRFRAPSNRIFLGQIKSAGEAIDLSPADEMWFVEYALSPRLMEQASKRIVNVEKKRNCFVRVVTIDQSVDDRIGERLLSLWASINGVVRQ